MDFSTNGYENQNMINRTNSQNIEIRNTGKNLGFNHANMSNNNMLDNSNLYSYQAKSDNKVRKKLSNKMKNSINLISNEYNNNKNFGINDNQNNNSNQNNQISQSNNESTQSSIKENSNLDNIETNKVLENCVLRKSNNIYITKDGTELDLWPNQNINNNNNANNIYRKLEDINTNEVILNYKKSNSANINIDNSKINLLNTNTKNVLESMKQNNKYYQPPTIDNQNNSLNKNDSNLNSLQNNNNSETQMMLDSNMMIKNQFNQRINNMGIQSNSYNNINNNYFGNFKIYMNNE